jgi:hypothetical protein
MEPSLHRHGILLIGGQQIAILLAAQVDDLVKVAIDYGVRASA